MMYTTITTAELNDLISKSEKAGRDDMDPLFEKYFKIGDKRFEVWRDKRTGKEYAVQHPTYFSMGFNTIEDDKVEEFAKLVRSAGAAKASWGVTGRTMHLMLAQQLASRLPEFDWDLDYDSYRCVATVKGYIY